MVPATAAPPAGVSVNVDELMVAALIAVLNVADITVLMATPVAPTAGVIDVTAGMTAVQPDEQVLPPEPDPPQPETTSATAVKKQAIPYRMFSFSLCSLFFERRDCPISGCDPAMIRKLP